MLILLRHHLWLGRFGGRNVAGANHQRNAQFVCIVDARYHLRVFQGYHHRRARHEVCDFLGEHVGAMLFQQCRRLAFAFCLLVGCSRLGTFGNLGTDQFIANAHLHRMNGCILVQREEIARIHRDVRWVHEGLPHGDGR